MKCWNFESINQILILLLCCWFKQYMIILQLGINIFNIWRFNWKDYILLLLLIIWLLVSFF